MLAKRKPKFTDQHHKASAYLELRTSRMQHTAHTAAAHPVRALHGVQEQNSHLELQRNQ
jgi:uncharacterized membrane protein YccC